jgi:hypothetical protein
VRFRFIRVVALLALLGGAFTGVARALDFDEEDPEPVRAEVGQVVAHEIGSHAGCLPHHYVIMSGQLPPGLKLGQLNDHTALVDGVPTEAGTWGVWLAVRDCADKSAENGTISGTPATAAASAFTVAVTADGDDGNVRTDSRRFTFAVAGAISVSAPRRAAEVGIPFRTALAATGGRGPYRWSATGAPPGLSVGSDGVISGVPARAGSFTLAAHLVDASGATKDATLVLVVYPRLSIATKRLPVAVAGRAYRAKIAIRGGAPAFRWTIARGTLPRGLRLAVGTGTIAGTPVGKGTSRVTLRVRDALGAVSQRALVLRMR